MHRRSIITENDISSATSLALSLTVVSGLLTFTVLKVAGIQDAGFRGIDAALGGLFGGLIMCAAEMLIAPGALAEFSSWSRNKKLWFFGGNLFIAFGFQRKGIEMENLPPANNLFEAGFNVMRFGLVEDGIILTLIVSSILISYLGYSIYRDMQNPSTFFSAPQEAVIIPEANNVNANLGANRDDIIIDAGEAQLVTFPEAEILGLRNRT